MQRTADHCGLVGRRSDWQAEHGQQEQAGREKCWYAPNYRPHYPRSVICDATRRAANDIVFYRMTTFPESPREAARRFTPELTALIDDPLYSDVWTDGRLIP